jgi:hypothetical protein
MNHEEYSTLKVNLPKAMLPCNVCGELVNFDKHPVLKTWIANIELSPEEKFKFTNAVITEMPLCWECYQFLMQFLTQSDKPKEFLRKFFDPTTRNVKFMLPKFSEFSEF